jgi:hypothetical protein
VVLFVALEGDVVPEKTLGSALQRAARPLKPGTVERLSSIFFLLLTSAPRKGTNGRKNEKKQVYIFNVKLSTTSISKGRAVPTLFAHLREPPIVFHFCVCFHSCVLPTCTCVQMAGLVSPQLMIEKAVESLYKS